MWGPLEANRDIYSSSMANDSHLDFELDNEINYCITSKRRICLYLWLKTWSSNQSSTPGYHAVTLPQRSVGTGVVVGIETIIGISLPFLMTIKMHGLNQRNIPIRKHDVILIWLL